MREKDWYGETMPDEHAVCLIGSIPADPAQPPYLHNSYFGKRAYEAWHTYHYLQDLFVHRASPDNIGTPARLLDLATQAIGAPDVEFLELGSSLFCVIERFDSCTARDPAQRPRIHWIGVEMSDWFCRLAETLHSGRDIAHYPTWRDVPAPVHPRFLLSNAVGNYAFESSRDYADWAMTARLSLLRERCTLGPEDVTTTLMGKRYVMPSLQALMARARARGFTAKIVAAQEASRCLDTMPAGGAPIVEAAIVIHDLQPAELDTFDRLLATRGDLGQDPNHNFYYAPLHLSPGMLRDDGADAFAGAVWKFNYLRAPEVTRDRETRFDFSNTTVRTFMTPHLESLKATYASATAARPAPTRAAEIPDLPRWDWDTWNTLSRPR